MMLVSETELKKEIKKAVRLKHDFVCKKVGSLGLWEFSVTGNTDLDQALELASSLPEVSQAAILRLLIVIRGEVRAALMSRFVEHPAVQSFLSKHKSDILAGKFTLPRKAGK